MAKKHKQNIHDVAAEVVNAATKAGERLSGKAVTQRVAQAVVNALVSSGVSQDDIMRAIVVPHLLADLDAVRTCGEHSGIPTCCIEHYVTKVLPAYFAGEKPPADDVVYVRCPSCRKADRRVEMNKCDCFYFTMKPS